MHDLVSGIIIYCSYTLTCMKQGTNCRHSHSGASALASTKFSKIKNFWVLQKPQNTQKNLSPQKF